MDCRDQLETLEEEISGFSLTRRKQQVREDVACYFHGEAMLLSETARILNTDVLNLCRPNTN